MMGIDPRAARATWTVILIGLLCLVIYSIRNTVFVFIVSLLFAYLLLPLLDFIDLVPILSFFFLKDGRMMQRYLVSQVADDVNRGVLKEIATDLNVLLAQYMRALVLLGLAASITYGIFFSIMGVPYAILLAA